MLKPKVKLVLKNTGDSLQSADMERFLMKQEAQTTKELNNNLKNIKSHQNIPLKKKRQTGKIYL